VFIINNAPHIYLPQRVVRLAQDIPLGSQSLLTDKGEGHALPFDQLVLALGVVSNSLGLPNVKAVAFDFKTLGDAIRIRNHVIDMFERAEDEPPSPARQAMLTFVVAGGGFAGPELAGAINDFARGMLVYYPNIAPEEVRVILVHSRDRILPELSEELAAYALERMAARGVLFKLNTRVADARPGAVILHPQEEIHTETLIWTAGTTPNPLIHTLPIAREPRGDAVVDTMLSGPGDPGVWAVGDFALVRDAHTGQPCPPPAQCAHREAHTLAHNIHASLQGQPLTPFHFDAVGALCVVGHYTACAEIKGHRFSGLFTWCLWRGVYLSKLPGLERKVRVLVDWIVELFFPRDIVQTIDFNEGRRELAEPSMASQPEQQKQTVSVTV